jgi:ATP-dependent Lon protease
MASDPSPDRTETLQIPDALPVLPLRNAVVFPLSLVPLVVGQPRSVRLVDDAMRANRLVALVAQRDDTGPAASPDDLHRIGTAGVIRQLARGQDGNLHIVVQGVERVRLLDFVSTEPYFVARVEPLPDRILEGTEADALRRTIIEVLRRLSIAMNQSEDIATAAESLTDARQLAYLVAQVAPIDTALRQELLELDPVQSKLRRLLDVLQREAAVRELGHKIDTETRERLSRSQREHILREQLRSIQRELGEEGEGSDTSDLRRRIDEAKLPGEARREADRELARLSTIPASSPEHGMIRTYLEWLASLPWSVTTGGAIELPRAREVLDEDHYDLEKIKDRLIEYLAVKKLRQERQPTRTEDTPAAPPAGSAPPREPILCFVGPPGVGKTSLGQSIARALGRKFVRISLGGLHDEAEIRGHRRTYIGALPGRFIQGIRRAEARDPVLMLDEIDKVGADWRGDPSSALLEVLDPAQNHAFVDTYLGVPFDLSQVFFIATANTLDTIPAPLLDRMEVIVLSGYTDDEKVHIAERYLVPKQLAASGLARGELEFEPEALRRIVRGYTREAGVRNLDREIAAVARKVARRIVEQKARSVKVTGDDIPEYLGRPRFFDEVAERTDRPGVATGLAWTPVGGDVLFVEATMVPGEERLVLTGMLGDVMRESAQAALTYVRSDAVRLGIDPDVFRGKTIHVHVPAGAIPKDGPSAGVTMMSAIASLATGRPVRSDVAMTGEVTLRGKVLAVGGIKEKVLAAHRAGIRRVVLPRHNERDVEDVPEELRRELTFVFADTADDVLAQTLTSPPAAVIAPSPSPAATSTSSANAGPPSGNHASASARQKNLHGRDREG